jgi:hypothetical protein
MIDTSWLAALLAAGAWTTFFSMFDKPGIRGYRNLGWVACYIIGVLMFFFASWRVALGTWAAVGVASGFLYLLYEVGAFLRSKDKEAKPRPRVILDGLYLWPIMLPEAIEYSLAELGMVISEEQNGGTR